MAGTLPPLFSITDDDHAGYVAVADYTFLLLMVFLVATRIFTRWYIVRYIKADDALLFVAALVGIAQSIIVQFAINHGLGRRGHTLSHHDFVLFQKYEYAAQILLVLCIALAKLSLCALIHSLVTEKYTLYASRSLLAIVIAWAFASILALAFQCPLPSPWRDDPHCVDQAALHYAIGALNIATDVALTILPCVAFWRVPDRKRRFQVVSLFSIRICAIVVTAMQLSHVGPLFKKGADKTWESINTSIWDQVMMNVSIFCTAIPSLGRLIVDLQPEINAFAITERHGSSNKTGDQYALPSVLGHRFKLSNRGVHMSVLGRPISRDETESMQGLREDGLRQDGIQQTVGFEVKYSPVPWAR